MTKKALKRNLTRKDTTETSQPTRTRGGREVTFTTPKQFIQQVDEYFTQCTTPQPLTDSQGNPIFNKDGTIATYTTTPTQSGLARFLGFKHRSYLYDYENKPLYSSAVKYARNRLAEYLEGQALTCKNPSGAIFLLQNLRDGWKDAKYIEHNDKAPKIAVVQFINKPQAPKLGDAKKPQVIDITAETNTKK